MTSEQKRIKVDPDLDFVQDLLENGGDSLKKCFQCGTCSVMCNLAPAGAPFPRREMILAQWGLKDQLMADPNVWLCHQCSDCSTHCPRGAKPGDVLGAIRKKVIETVAVPSFMGKAVGDPRYLPFIFAVPALIILAAIFLNPFLVKLTDIIQPHHVAEAEAGFTYGHLLNHWVINGIYVPLTGLAALAFLAGINKLWSGISGQGLVTFLAGADKARLGKAAIDTVTKILTHSEFDQCDANKSRKLAHMLVLYAFIGLLVVTALAIVVLFAYEYFHITWLGAYPLSPLHPIKWIAYASAAALCAGVWLMYQNRRTMGEKGDMGTSYWDSMFLYLVGGVAVTGLIAMLMRYFDLQLLGYMDYFVHLVLVFVLLVYAPYSKFAHFVYRTVALIYLRYQELPGTAAASDHAEEEAAEAA